MLELKEYTKECISDYSVRDLELLDKDKEVVLIPLSYDPMLKKVFGNNTDIFRKFLISVLHLDTNGEEVSIVFGVNDLPKKQIKNYGSRVDINIIINGRIRVNLEINQERFVDVADRNFLFATKMHTLNVIKGTDYEDFHKYETIQINLNTHSFGTEKNGSDVFYITSENTGEKLVGNFKIIIKDLAYFYNLYYTNNGNCEEDQIWLAMLMSRSFQELGAFLERLLTREERNRFLREVINMGQKEFFLHEWEPEAMRRIVEGRKAYNEEQRRLEFAKMQEEIDVSRKKLGDGNKKLEDGKKELEEGKKELERLLDEKNKIEHNASSRCYL